VPQLRGRSGGCSLGGSRLRLLLYQNLSRKLLAAIEGPFPASAHILPLGLSKSTDSDIWYYARHQGYTLVTKNTDMVDLCILRGAPPKVLWLRVGNCSTSVVRDVLLGNTQRIERFEQDENVVMSLFRFFTIE
jgi:predicted nuclease of predicted toxin-antitoxin system